ncbi:hypothetical protein AAHA92_31181 [Salvia divinorum]|uniref:Uncharacterized protein n=1 Tax=Salvia divinorum TaxID=28513 RepID=A0ABD1FU98_SALDI
MVVLVEKLGRSLNFPSSSKPKPLDRHLKSAPLADFRSKISEFIAGMGSELLSLKGFNKCFELIHTSNSALADLAIQIDYPMRQWGPCLTAEYLSCTSDLLSLSNAVTSSVSHLTHAKMRLLHALSTSPATSAAARLAAPPQQKIRFEKAIMLGERGACSRQERVLLEALIMCRKLGLLALGLVVSGLCGDAESYMEMRRKAGGIDDPLLKEVDMRFCKEVVVMEEVGEVEMGVEEVKRRLKVMEDSLQRINTQTDHLFSQLLNARNKLIAHISFPE